MLKRFVHWFKVQYYGECDTCKVILKPNELWGFSECPVCKRHYHWW
jgi:hypothetical protein